MQPQSSPKVSSPSEIADINDEPISDDLKSWAGRSKLFPWIALSARIDDGNVALIPASDRIFVTLPLPIPSSILFSEWARRTEPNRTLGEPEQRSGSFPGKHEPNRTVAPNGRFVWMFGSCSVGLVQYNVVSRIFRILGSLVGQSYVSLSGSQTTTWKLVVYIPQRHVLSAISAHFYLKHIICRASDWFPQIGRTKWTRTESNRHSWSI